MVEIPRAVEAIETFLVDRLADAGAEGYVVGVSGGLDSAVVTHLAVGAVGPDAVRGLVMPGRPNSEANMADARALCADLGVEHETLSITPVVDSVEGQLPFDPGKRVLGNVRARTRMVVEYAVANEREYLVLGAGNRSEGLLGYFTKYGDAAVDVQPMADLYKTEVADVAQYLDVDERFVEKTPTAALWEAQTDEDEIGVDYETIDAVLRRLVDEELSTETVAAETNTDRETVDHLREMWKSSVHKRSRPSSPDLRDL